MRSFGIGAAAALLAAWITGPAPQAEPAGPRFVAQVTLSGPLADIFANHRQGVEDWRRLNESGGIAPTIGSTSLGDFLHHARR